MFSKKCLLFNFLGCLLLIVVVHSAPNSKSKRQVSNDNAQNSPTNCGNNGQTQAPQPNPNVLSMSKRDVSETHSSAFTSTTTSPQVNSSGSEESQEHHSGESKKQVEVLIVPVIIRPRPIIIIEEIDSVEDTSDTTTADYDDSSSTPSSSSVEDNSSSNEQLNTSIITTNTTKSSQNSQNDLVHPDNFTLKPKVLNNKVDILPVEETKENQSNEYFKDDLKRERRDVTTESPQNNTNDTQQSNFLVVKVVQVFIIPTNDTDNSTETTAQPEISS